MRPFSLICQQRPDAKTEPTRTSPRLVFFAAAAAVFLLPLAAFAQQPRAVVTGPKEARCGALIVLDGTASEGVGRLWLLAVAPEETSFLPVESATKCIFASPTPGRYEFVLIVAGTNSNGDAAAEMTRHTVTLSGGGQPPVVPPGTPPPVDPPPSISPTACVYVYEKDQTAIPRAVQAALQRLNANGLTATDMEVDTTDGDGDVPEQYRAAVAEARKAGLPCLVVLAGTRVVRVVKSPTTEQHVTEAVK